MGNKSSRASEGGGHGKTGVKHKIKKLKKSVIKHRLESAKKLGTLQLVGGGLTALPKEVGKSLLHVCMQCYGSEWVVHASMEASPFQISKAE